MALANWEENDSVKAKQIWLDYGGQSVEEDLYPVDFPFDG
jgi:hypothetical protein